MDNVTFCDLLIVKYDDRKFVVEAPGCEANSGDIVKFSIGKMLAIGEVLDAMHCIKGEAEYRCVSRLHTIYLAKRIYRRSWDEPEEACDS